MSFVTSIPPSVSSKLKFLFSVKTGFVILSAQVGFERPSLRGPVFSRHLFKSFLTTTTITTKRFIRQALPMIPANNSLLPALYLYPLNDNTWHPKHIPPKQAHKNWQAILILLEDRPWRKKRFIRIKSPQ